jgi:peptide/nickel transport system permease protein
MISYIVRRILQSIVVVLGVATLIFLALRLSGDPVVLIVGAQATPEEIQRVRSSLGLDRPIHIQYLSFLSDLVRGDFGVSLRLKSPALPLVLERLPASLELALAASLLATVSAVPLGIVSAIRRNSIVDNVSMFFSLLGQSIPTFWLGVMAILLFSVRLGVLPTSGRRGWAHLILPSVSLAAYSMARIARLTRSAMLDVLGEDYLQTARSKGLRERVVIYRHALRNASISIVTVIAYMFAALLGGAIVTEVVFAWPGVGRLLVEAVHGRDYPVAQACVFVIAIFVTLVNLVADILYVYIDPRIRLDE